MEALAIRVKISRSVFWFLEKKRSVGVGRTERQDQKILVMCTYTLVNVCRSWIITVDIPRNGRDAFFDAVGVAFLRPCVSLT